MLWYGLLAILVFVAMAVIGLKIVGILDDLLYSALGMFSGRTAGKRPAYPKRWAE